MALSRHISISITVQLNSITYDLVPAKEDISFWGTKFLQIPGNDGWRKTDPNDVKVSLTNANSRYAGVVRPLIRLMKAWNCHNGYPYDSYLLELEIIGMDFSGDNVQSGLFYIGRMLQINRGDSLTKQSRILALKRTLDEVRLALEGDNFLRAKMRLHSLFPLTR